jgi:hypothetical protein
MRPSLPSPAGFTGIELVLVLAVLGVLGGVGYAATARYRAHAAEAELRQDLVHFVNQQQSLHEHTGALGTLRRVEERGYRVSPGVVVEDSRVDARGRRAYLRVLHRGTGQRCSVDYSPFVSVAINRVQCWDPAGTERAGAADAPEVARVATVEVVQAGSEPPPPPPPPCADVPGLAAPADLTGAPGSMPAGVFMLTNPTGAARTYSLLWASSNALVVPAVDGPSSITVPAGASHPLSASVPVAPRARAGQVAVVTVQATDDLCPASSADAFFTVAAERVLGTLRLAPPASRTVAADATVEGTWRSSMDTNDPRMMVLTAEEEPGLLRENADGTGRRAYEPEVEQPSPLRYRLDGSRVDGLQERSGCMTFHDALEPAHRTRECFTLRAELEPRNARLAVRAPAEADPGEIVPAEWTVANATNAERRFRIVPAVSGDLELVSAEGVGDAVVIPRNGVHTVSARYRVLRGSVARTLSRGSLRVTDADPQYAPRSDTTAWFDVSTRLRVCAPEVVSAPAPRAEKPGAAFAATWRIRNCTNDRRDLSFTPSAHADVLPGDALTRPFDPFEERDVTVGYRMRSRSVHLTPSDPSLVAADAGVGGTSSLRVTTALDLQPPALTGPTGAPVQPQLPATGATLAYTLHNRSNAPRPFAYAATSTDPAAAAIAGVTSGGTVGAYDSVRVELAYAVPDRALGGASAVLLLAARDPEAGTASVPFQVGVREVRVAPRVAFPLDQTVQPGATETNTATLHNGSNVAMSVCLAVEPRAGSVAAGQVVPAPRVSAPAPPGCMTVAPFADASATVTYAVADSALAGQTNPVALRAWDAADESLTGEHAFTVTTALLLRNPVIVGPSRKLSWYVGDEREMAYSIRNTSNATRTLCVRFTSDDPTIFGLLGGEDGADTCVWTLAPGASATVSRWFAAHKATEDIQMRAQVTDAADRDYRAVWVHPHRITSINNVPTAAFEVRSLEEPNLTRFWTRKWHTFDASSSRSPDAGGPIVKYEWKWGRMGEVWSDQAGRFVPGSADWDVQISPAVNRAYDEAGTWQICLRVTNERGKQAETCEPVTFQRETRARLSFTYDTWWTNHPLDGFGGIGAGNGHDDHGTQRFMFYPQGSLGGVPISRAWIILTTRFYNWEGDSEEVVTYSSTQQPNGWASEYLPGGICGSQPIEFYLPLRGAQHYRCWENLFRLEVSPVNGVLPDMLQTETYNRRGIWGEDVKRSHRSSQITLYVTDVNGRTTSAVTTFTTAKSPWNVQMRNGAAGEPAPAARFERVESTGGSTLFADVVGSSRDGRVVERWIEYEEPNTMDGSEPRRYAVLESSVTVDEPPCGTARVYAMVRDDTGRVGSAEYIVSSPNGPCMRGGGFPGEEALR